jgi:hypothetical protein
MGPSRLASPSSGSYEFVSTNIGPAPRTLHAHILRVTSLVDFPIARLRGIELPICFEVEDCPSLLSFQRSITHALDAHIITIDPRKQSPGAGALRYPRRLRVPYAPGIERRHPALGETGVRGIMATTRDLASSQM